ncbi:Egg cell-secreted protein 1.1 [Euphorbia peplus]|nr:Egg cell-secreted protein 1.1 [Euphorbia peplus]
MSYKIVCMILSLTLMISTGYGARNMLIKQGNGKRVAAAAATLGDCWSALVEIKSCSNEIILFFLNGETDIQANCCRSIAIITHNCWPAMLSSLGFTAEQGSILRGYCDYPYASSPSMAPAAAPSSFYAIL